MIRPPSLNPGDAVGLVAPSRTIAEHQVKTALGTFQAWGLEVVKGKHLFGQHGYFAGTDRQRLSDLQEMINDDRVKAIFCARGGYGITRILDDLDLSALRRTPKWIIGFSDITALHLALNRMDLESIHGFMPVQFEYMNASSSIKSLEKLLFEDRGMIEAESHALDRQGKAEGQVVGGNLSLLVDSLGTASEVQTAGKLLFLEEVDEYLYKIDRMLTHLKRAQKLDRLEGLVIGDFSQMKDTQIPLGMSIEELIMDRVKEYSYPVAFNFAIGHEIPNYSIPLMRNTSLEVGQPMSKMTFDS
ncbi:MAG: LD-carboxypeptidase [Cytophagales bacterium]|nr:LD-carboxypeptidase [Cytophagales bacterium]